MTYSGGGTTILTGASTYTNVTIVNGTDLQLTSTASLNSSSAFFVTNNGNFDLSLLSAFTLGSGQRFEGNGGTITAPTGAATITGPGSSIYPGTDGTAGALNFSGNLTMAIGSTANFDLSSSSSGANDSMALASGKLILNGNSFHIKAPSTSSSLDTSADYVLITANSVQGGFSPTPVWDVQPVNASGFRVLTLNGNEVVLRYSTLNPPTAVATATPTNLVRYGTVFISVTVTPGSSSMTGGTVTVDTTALGGGFGQPLVEVGSTLVYTNTFTVSPNAVPGAVALQVTITDSGNQIGVAFIPVNILQAFETWNGSNHAVDQNWDDGKNWVSTLPPGFIGDNLIFAGSTGLTPTVDQNYSPNSISFAAGAGAFFLTNGGSGTLTMTGGSSVTNSASIAETFALPLTLSGAAAFRPVSGNIVLSQPIGESTAGAGVLVSAGPGTNVLIANESYTGGTTISGGTLQLADPGMLNNGDSTSPITDNGVFLFSSQQAQTLVGVISGTGGIVVNGGSSATTNGFLTLDAANTFTGNIGISNGTLIDAIAEGNGNPVATGLGNSQTSGKTVTIGTNGTLILAAGGGNEFGYGGVVPAIAFVINQGGLMEVTSGNVQINTVTLNGGTLLAASGDTSLQYPTYGVGGAITTGGTAQSVITNIGDVNADYVTLGDGASAGYQTLFTVGSTGTGAADLAIGAQLTDTGAATYGSVFTGLIKAGPGTMLLTAQNVYQGTTTLSNGIVSLGSAENPGTSGPLGNSAAINPGSIVFAGGTLQYSTVNQNDYSARFSTAANQLVSLDVAGQSITCTNPLVSSGGSLTVIDSVGGGVLTLSATNTYTGATTVTKGKLVLTSTGSVSNSSKISVGAGGTFDVTSQASFAVPTTGSVTGSGTASPASIAAQAISFGSRPITLNYDGSHPALTISSGTLTLNGNSFTVNGSPLSVAGSPYTLIHQNSGSIISSGTYTATGTAIGGANQGTITVSGGNVLLTLTVVTPPTMTFSITGGNSLNISWSSAYLGAALLYQSNSPITGLQTNASAWLVWPGSTNVTSEVIPIGKTNEVFFQLLYP
jgi:autotransporter-associated beta strand protein